MVNVGRYTIDDPMGPEKKPRLKQRADGNVAGAGAGAAQLRAIQKTRRKTRGVWWLDWWSPIADRYKSGVVYNPYILINGQKIDVYILYI